MIKIPRNLIKETKQIIQMRIFLDECGLSRYYFSPRQLRKIVSTFSRKKK